MIGKKKERCPSQTVGNQPKGIVVPCATHSLNLVVADAGNAAQRLLPILFSCRSCSFILNLTLKSRIKQRHTLAEEAGPYRCAICTEAVNLLSKTEASERARFRAQESFKYKN